MKLLTDHSCYTDMQLIRSKIDLNGYCQPRNNSHQDEAKKFRAINTFRTFVMNEHTVAMFDKVQPGKDLYRK